MVSLHRLVGEAAAIVAGILDSPVLLEVSVELLEVILREDGIPAFLFFHGPYSL